MTARRGLAAGCLAVALAVGLSACRHPLRSEGTSVTPPTVPGASASAIPAPATPSPAVPAPSGTGGPVSQQDVQRLQGIVSGANSAVAAARSAMAGDSATPPH